MKILNPYRFFRGGKGEQDTPSLIPPRQQNIFRSISMCESVDILCEGPIYGLVDQFGRKIYGLDMLKGIYLNKTPVMNANGEYNFRNVLMEINLGTENQKPLANFTNVYINKPSSFKLLGPINNQRNPDGSVDVRTNYTQSFQLGRFLFTNAEKGVPAIRNFSAWAIGWPTQTQDPFIFVHQIKNKDVKKVRVSLLVEALFDTVDMGKKGKGEDIGLSKSATLRFLIRTGIDGEAPYFIKEYSVNGTAQSPFAMTVGEPVSQFASGLITTRLIGGPTGGLLTAPNQNTGGGGTTSGGGTTGGGNGTNRTTPGGDPPIAERKPDNTAAS
jgi:hypothetical protein